MATDCPYNANNKSLLWTSSNTTVATVDSATGYVTAKAAGETTIKATAKDGSGKYGTCTLKVDPAIPVQSITMCCDNHIMNVGETFTLSYVISPANATDQTVYWHSSDPYVATVGVYSGTVTAIKAGTATITAMTMDGGFVARCTVTAYIDTVTIMQDGTFNKVVFNSTGKVWRCINHDMIFDEDNMNNTLLIQRSNHNFFTCYNESDPLMWNTTPKEYTDEEIKLLYAIDPYGVAHYVQRYASEQFYVNELEGVLGYKDRIFRLLFNREPKYFARTIDGVWYEVTEYEEINDVLSESETIFGMHPIYDARTWIELLQFASTIIGIAFGTTFIGGMLSAGINIIATVHVVALATDFNTVKNELSGYVSDTVTGDLIEEHFKDTIIDWASDYVSLYDSLQDLSDAMTLDLSYSKAVINYCACDTGYNVLFEMKNGTTYRLHDVCDLINE